MATYSTGGFHVDPDDLDSRATQTDSVVDRVRQATDLARPIDRGSYGLAGQAFAALAALAADQATTAFGQLATAIGQDADALRTSRTAYASVERTLTSGFDGIAR